MAYDISSMDSRLKAYLDGNRDELVTKAVFNSKTSQLLNIQTGVKTETPIVRLDTTVTLADGSNCGFNAQGSDVFSNRILKPAYIKLNKSYCSKNFLDSWRAYEVKMAATKQEESMPYEAEILDSNLKNLSAVVEKLLWQGDTQNGTGNMALADGFVSIMSQDISNSVIPAGNVIAKGSDSIWTRTQKLWLALDPAMADDATILMSISNYKQLLVDLSTANLYHIFESYEGEGDYRMTMPGTNVEIRGIEGLEGVDWIIATPLTNLYYGVDLENDNEDVDLFWSKDDRIFKLVVEFCVAVNYAIPEYIYINK